MKEKGEEEEEEEEGGRRWRRILQSWNKTETTSVH
jgi:hypothetical protein